MADDASTHLGPQIDVVVEADLQQAESAASALGTVDKGLGHVTETLTKVAAAAAKLEPILTSVSQSLDNLSGKGLEYDTISRGGKLPIIENIDFVSKDIKKIGAEVAKELKTMVETLVTEVGVMGDGFRRTLGPIITEARQVRKAANSVIQFPQEQGIDTIQGITIQSHKEFERSEKLTIAQEDAQYKDYSDLVHSIQLKQENLTELRKTKNAEAKKQLLAYEAVLDKQIDHLAMKHGLDIEQVTKSVTAGEEIQEDAIRMLIESSLGAKGRPVVDLSSTKYLNWAGANEDETAQIKLAISKALTSMPVYKRGMRDLRPIEKELNKLLRSGSKPEQIQAALSRFLEAYNKIAITYNNLDESITTLMSGSVLPIDEQLLADLKDSTDVINGSLNLSLVDFKPAVIPQLPPKPQPTTLNRAQIIQQIKAKPRTYQNVVPSVQKAQEIAGARKTVYVDIETGPKGEITHTSLLSGGTNEVIVSGELPSEVEDWHAENIIHEAYNPTQEFAKSRGAKLTKTRTYAESLLQIVKRLTGNLKGLKVATYGDSDLEVIIAEMNRLVINGLAPEVAEQLTAGAGALRVVQQDRLVNVLDKVKRFFDLIQPGFYESTVKSKGLSALVPIVQKIMTGADKLVPHIPVDDNVLTAGLDQLLDGPNAALELYVSKETLHKPTSEWTLSPEFSAYLTGVLESPVYQYAQLVSRLGRLKTDNFKERLPIETKLRELELAHSDVRTISEEGLGKVLSSVGVIESGFRPYTSQLSLMDTTPVSPIETAMRSSQILEQAISHVAEGIARPANRNASLTTIRNAVDKGMLDKIFASLVPAPGTTAMGNETSKLLDSLFGNENMKLLQGATSGGTVKSIIYDFIIKYTGQTDFSAFKLDDAAYINNLNARLTARNYAPNADLSRVIPAKPSDTGNLYSQTKLHGAEVDDFLAFLGATDKIFKDEEAALSAFRAHKEANPSLFPIHLGLGGEAAEIKNNALLAQLPGTRVIGGKTGLVGASKDLEGGFGTVFHAIDEEGSRVFSIMARFDEALVDASAGIDQAVKILILDVKQRSRANSAAEVVNDPKLTTQLSFYAASHGLPTGVAVDTHTNILEIALFKMAGDVDRSILDIMQRVGKSLGKNVISVAKEHFGDFEGTLQTALNSIAAEAGSKVSISAKQVIDTNRLYGVNPPQLGFTPDSQVIAQSLAAQNFTKLDTFGKEQQIFSETNTARLLGTAAVQPEIVQGTPTNSLVADKTAFDALNTLLGKLRVNLEGLTSHELINGLIGHAGTGVQQGNGLALTLPDYTRNLTTAIDTVSNLAMEDAGKARAFLAQGAANTQNIVPQSRVADVISGIQAEATAVEEARRSEAIRAAKSAGSTLPARVEPIQNIHIPISEAPTAGNAIVLSGSGGAGGGGGNRGGGSGSDYEDDHRLPPGREAILEARPDSAKEYRLAAGTVGVNEELYGKSLGTVQNKAAAAADEIKRLIGLVASTVGTTFLDSAQKDFLAFDIKIRETSLGLEAFKRAQHTVASGDIQVKSFDNSIRGMQTELSQLERLAKNGDKLLPNQTERLQSLPTIIDYTKAQKANIEDKVRVARTEVDMWKELQRPPEGMTSQQFFGNTIRRAEALADRAAAKQRIDLYTENRDAILSSVGPQKTESHKLLQADATRAEGLVSISHTDTLLAQKALVTGLRAEFANLDSNVTKYGSDASKEFVSMNDKVKQQIELVKLLEKDKASLEGKFTKQTANLDRTDLSDTQRRSSVAAQGRLGQALSLNAAETETALKTITSLLTELDSKALKARQSLAAAMRLDYTESIKRRTGDIADELSMLSEKSKAGLGTPGDALRRAQLNYENAALNKGDISGAFTKLLEKEEKNRYNLNSRAQGVEHADIFAGLQDRYGMKDNGLFQSLTSDYARLLSTPKLGASAIGASTDTVEQKLKELKHIEDEIARGKAEGKQSVVVNLKVNWNQTRQEIEAELDKLKGLLEAKFRESLDPAKLKAQYAKNQTELEGRLTERRDTLTAKGIAGTQTLADQTELRKLESEILANRDSGAGYAKSLLAQLSPASNPLDSIHSNERLKGLGFGAYADQGNVTDAYRRLMGKFAQDVAKGDKSGPQSQLDKLFTELNQAVTNRDFLDKKLEQYKGKDLTTLPQDELGNLASLTEQRRREHDRATKLQQQLPAAIETAEAVSMSPASILQKHAEINTALRTGLNLKKQWIEADITAGFKTDENLTKLREVNKQLVALNDVPVSRRDLYTQGKDARVQELQDKQSLIHDDMSAGVLTLDKFKQLQQLRADLARTSGAGNTVDLLYAMQPKVESPLKSFNANQNLASLGFGAQAEVLNPIEVFKKLGAQLARSTAESGPAYSSRVDDLMTQLAESNAKKAHAQGITKPYERMTSAELGALAPEEAQHLGNAKKTIQDEIATATKLIGELHTAINSAQAHELSDPQMLKRYADAISLLKEGLAIEKQWLDAEVKLGIASAEHVKRLQEVNLQTARLNGDAQGIAKYSKLELGVTTNPLHTNSSLNFASRVAERAGLQDVGINFDASKSTAGKQALEGLVSEFSKLNLISNSYSSNAFEKSFLALQKNYDLAKLYDAELVKVNATLALDPGNIKASEAKVIYLSLLREQLTQEEKLVKEAKEQLRIQQELDNRPHVLAAAAAKHATSILDTNVKSEDKIRADISAGIDIEGNIKRLQALEKENAKLREAKAAGPGGLTSAGSAEELSKLHGVDLGGQKRGAAGFVEQIANMGTWWAEWTLGQSAMQAVPNAIQSGIAFAKEFEAQMKNVELITQANKVQFEQLVGTIGQLSTSRIFSPKDLAEGLIILGQAGFNAVESMKLLPAVTDLATATLSSLKVAADITTTAIEAFNVPIAKAGDLANTLAAITIESKLEINSLGTTFNYIAESAAGAGLSIEQIGTAMGLMSNAGVRASTIGTSLRSVLGTFMAPTDKFKAELGKVGMSVEDVNPRYRELGTILMDLKDKGFDVQSAFLGLDKRIAGAVTSLISTSGDYQDFIGKISGTDRATTMAEGQMDTFDAQGKRLQHGLQLLGGETFGPALGPMKEITGTLATIVEHINTVVNVIPPSARAVLGLGTAFGLASTALFTMTTGFKMLFATQAGGAAANIWRLITDKNVFSPAQSILATGQTLPAGALSTVTGVRRQFLEIIQSFINLQNIGGALLIASAAGLAYKGLQKLSGKEEVAEARHTADVTGAYATELSSLEKVLTTATDKTTLYHLSIKKLREEYGLLSVEQLKIAASNARITAVDTDITALDKSASQKVNNWTDFFTSKGGRKEKVKSAADDAIQSLKKQGLYYSGSETDVIGYLNGINKDNTTLGSMTTEAVLLQRMEDTNSPDIQRKRLDETRQTLLKDNARKQRLTTFDSLMRDTQNTFEPSWSPLITVSSAGPGKEDYVSIRKALTGSVGGEEQKRRDKTLAELKAVIKDAGLTDATKGVSDEMLISMYQKHLKGTAKGYIYDQQLKPIFDTLDTGADTSKLDTKLAMDSSKYLMEKGQQTGIVYSGAQLAILEELRTTKTKWSELKEKVKHETNEGLRSIWEDDLATAEATMKRLAKSASVLLIEKLPGFEVAKGIPKGVLQTLDQFVPYINAGVTSKSTPEEIMNIQQYNTQQLKGVNPADLPEAGKKLEAVKKKYDELLASSGLAKFDPKKAGEEWSAQHEVYFAIHGRMDLEMQETVESVIASGWAKIEPKLAKVKTALQDMLKMKQFGVELGFSTSRNEVNVQAAQATLDYLNQYKPQTYGVTHKGGIDVTTQTGRFVNDPYGISDVVDRSQLYTQGNGTTNISELGRLMGMGMTNRLPGPNDRFISAELKTKHTPGVDWTSYANPDDISYDWKRAGEFKPYFQRGGVDPQQEFRISQQKEFGTIQVDLAKSEGNALEKMRAAVLTYGYELGTYTKRPSTIDEKAAAVDAAGKIPALTDIFRPQTGTKAPKQGSLEDYMAKAQTATSPLELFATTKGMEEQLLLDQAKAKSDRKLAETALASEKQKMPAAGTVAPEYGYTTAVAESNIKRLEETLAAAKAKEVELNQVTADKIVTVRKAAYTAIGDAQKESLNGIYAALQKELAMQIAIAKKIEESRAYRGQVKAEAQTVMEGFAKSTGDWKEPTGQEKVSRVATLQSDMEEAFRTGKIEEGKKAYAKLKETAVKYRDDGYMNTDDKRRLGDVFASSAQSVDYYMQKDERKLQEESDDRGRQLQPIIKKKLEETKKVLDVTQDELSKMNSSDQAKHVQNLEKYKALESMSSLTPEQIGKMGSDERMKAVFDKDRLDIDGFSKAADRFAQAVDLLLARAQETGAIPKDGTKPQTTGEQGSTKVALEVSFTENATGILAVKMKPEMKEAAKEVISSELGGLQSR